MTKRSDIHPLPADAGHDAAPPEAFPNGCDFNSGDMKRDWEARARCSAKEYILTGYGNRNDEEFWASARGAFESWRGFVNDRSVVVDLGAGIGRLTREVAPHVKTIYAVDVSAEMLRQARQNLAAFPNVVFYENDGYRLDQIPDGSVDFIFANLVLHHVFEDACQSYLREAARILRPGGRFWFSVGWRAEGSNWTRPSTGDTFTGRFYTDRELAAMLGRRMTIESREVPPGSPFCVVVARKKPRWPWQWLALRAGGAAGR